MISVSREMYRYAEREKLCPLCGGLLKQLRLRYRGKIYKLLRCSSCTNHIVERNALNTLPTRLKRRLKRREGYQWCRAVYPGWRECPKLEKCSFAECEYPERKAEYTGETLVYSLW